MTLPSSGALAASAVNTELQLSSNVPFQLSDVLVRHLAKKQTAGSPISMADLRGRSFTAILSDINPPAGTNGINTSQRSAAISYDGNVVAVVGSSNQVYSGGQLISGGGALMIYERNSSGVLQLTATFIFTSQVAFNDRGVVAISDDGSRIVVSGLVGPAFTHPSSGPTNFYYNGGVATFYKSSGSWTRGTDVFTDFIYWSGYFGLVTSPTRNISISSDGSTMAVSADERGDPAGSGNVGAVYIYSYTGSGSWVRTQKIKPSGSTVQPYYHVQLSADGNTMLVGTDGFSSLPRPAWVYKRSSGTYSFFASCSPSITGVVASDPDLSVSTNLRGEYGGYFLTRDGNNIMARVAATKGSNLIRRHVWYSIGVSTISPVQVIRTVPPSFGTQPLGSNTEDFPVRFWLSGDGRRMCGAFSTVNSSFLVTATYMVFWFRHPTTDVWVYQGATGVTYSTPSSANMRYYEPCLNGSGDIGACSTIQSSPNLVIQMSS